MEKRRKEKGREGQMALDRQYETTIERQRERDRERDRERERESGRETERKREETVQINYI